MMAEKPVSTVKFPRQTAKTSARMLRGHRMGALKDGWLMIYENEEKPATDDLVDQLCIVKTADHQVLIRFLKKGRRHGTWDLLTVTGEQMLDVVLIWAAKVTMILPYEPTPEEAEQLMGIE